MTHFAVLIVIVISIACGSYALMILGRLRKVYRLDFLNSFFYYEFLHLGFGIYGILGGLAIREILLKFDLQSAQIETIVVAIPFFGIPFLVAGWFLFLKMVYELSGKEVPPFVSIIYFTLTTISFLIYGIILRGSGTDRDITPEHLSQIIRIVFYSINMAIVIYAMSVLITSAIRSRNQSQRLFLTRLALLFPGISIMSSVALHLAASYKLAGLYFILVFFGANLGPIILTGSYLRKNAARYTDVTDKLEDLYQRYGISRREREIITEICSGLTNQQIADKLFISLQTVKDHTHNIFKKVNASNRVQVVQIFS